MLCGGVQTCVGVSGGPALLRQSLPPLLVPVQHSPQRRHRRSSSCCTVWLPSTHPCTAPAGWCSAATGHRQHPPPAPPSQALLLRFITWGGVRDKRSIKHLGHETLPCELPPHGTQAALPTRLWPHPIFCDTAERGRRGDTDRRLEAALELGPELVPHLHSGCSSHSRTGLVSAAAGAGAAGRPGLPRQPPAAREHPTGAVLALYSAYRVKPLHEEPWRQHWVWCALAHAASWARLASRSTM